MVTGQQPLSGVAHVRPQTGSAPQERAGGPRAEYVRRLEDRRQEAVRLARREGVLGNARLVVFVAGVVLGWLAFASHLLYPWWLAVPVATFITLLFVHERVTRAWYRAGRAYAFYQRGLARLDDAWAGKGQTGERFLNPDHPYAADIDVFGKGSLFELLCTARTRTGEDTLAAWLSAAAGADEVRARQAAVAELTPQLDLREDLALLGDDVPSGVDFNAVANWGAAPPELVSVWPRLLASGLGLMGVYTAYELIAFLVRELFGAGTGSPLAGAGPFYELISFMFAYFFGEGKVPPLVIVAAPFLAFLFCDLLLVGWLKRRVKRVLHVVTKRAHDLALLANMLARLERATFTSPRLVGLHAALAGPDRVLPSQCIARLGNLLELLDSRRNMMFAPVACLLLWGTQMACAIERWRARSGPAIAGWLSAVGQFEALCALAAYAHENPADPFPEVVTGETCYEGEALGHPLLPKTRCVRNDLKLGGELRVLVVSGSNMSGKSTFLRTVGINAVLALAGAPVRAKRLRLCPLAVGATLRIQDSLQAGRSRFYAEILRVRQVVDLSRGPLPLLFLLDEIFAGTNSHDRGLGAEALVRGLVEAGAIGLVTTHDLSLTHIADRLGPRGANVHFADRFEEGVMTFDYCLRPGVVQHSNALALMRAVGLEV